MKRQHADTRTAIFGRFLGQLADPVPEQQIEKARARVLASLQAGESERLSPVHVLTNSAPPAVRWSAIAVAALVLCVAGGLQTAFLQPVIVGEALARDSKGSIYRQGEPIRSHNDSPLLLSDDSRIEMSADAVLYIARENDGLRVHLSEGQLIVSAAKQGSGHLYVETKDCLVSVVGTVFSVNTTSAGSRVSVVEGEVQVRHGERVQTLLPGQQVSTGSIAQPVSVKADIGWSSDAPRLVELLEQAAPPAQPAPPQDQDGTIIRGKVTHQGVEPLRDVVLTLCPDLEVPTSGVVSSSSTFSAFFFLGASQCQTLVSATTDEAGQFLIKNVEPGRYVVRAQKSGYLAAFEIPIANPTFMPRPPLELWSWEGGASIGTKRILVDQQPRAIEVNLSLVRPGGISGKVRDADGKKPAPYVPVRLGTVPDGNPPVFTVLASVNTNASGDYRFRVPPGNYVVFAAALAFNPGDSVREITTPLSNWDSIRVSVKEGETVTVGDVSFRDP